MSKREWGPCVTMQLATFFDGRILGEQADYEAQKDKIKSKRMLKEL